MAASRSTTTALRDVLGVGVVVALLLFAAPALSPASAQSRSSVDRGGDVTRSTPGGSGLPSWAEPQSGRSAARGGGADVGGPLPSGVDLPPPGNRVPVDGGVIWLALAGGAYAVHRLRRNGSGDETGDAPPHPPTV